ncbi:tRNA pseudouridine(38-40) synthase TruA [Papillibacter cinnamivorans]|uniref:tRNA pseudouridine synthase A n=1 Tax=Papillibacter cinnamivorans DSM 12816 TaxID=1122930 RepID=A0A1W2B709_9FIRM|nr:tRNA pseudouridine(38-40) synthase TruA [Papillibacter cinnamivorans]SMC68813.1 tRNA pseudouridine38-40 synthase [Papillibacter cinnamivorans DSM 12816]
MRNIALRLMYVGTNYHGWQVQKTLVTVGETLEKALSLVTEHPVKAVGCGRTDAGVHAEEYVANFRTASTIPADRIPLAVNARLPDDIVVRYAADVGEEFNAIASCRKKEYTYRIYNSKIRNPFYVNRAYFYPRHLDETVMSRAASMFEGTHDFRAVRATGSHVKTTVRTVHYCVVERRGPLVELRVCADGFLYNMVRAITGTVIYASEGKLAPDEIPGILERGVRTAAGPTVPPGGLYMTRLWYDEPALSAERETAAGLFENAPLSESGE